MLIQKIKKQLVLLSLLGLVLVAAFYLLLQSDTGAKLISGYLSNGDYSIKIGAVSHSLKTPTKITLNQVDIVQNKTGTALLQSENITFSFSFLRLWKTHSWDLIIIKNAQLSLDLTSKARPFVQSDRLQLQNVALKLKNTYGDTIQAIDINGGIAPWISSLSPDSNPVQFDLTAGQIISDGLTLERLAISGFEKGKVIYLTNFGGNIDKGFFIGQGGRLVNDDWQIDDLQINHLTIENEITFKRLLARHDTMPKIHIRTLNVVDSSVNFPRLKIEKANIEIKNLMYSNDWGNENTAVIFDARSIRWHDELFVAPALKLVFFSDRMIIEHATSKWHKGMISMEGRWQKGEWELKKLVFTGINLLLPDDWLSGFSHLTLPNYFSNLTIKTWKMKSSAIVSTNPTLAMQITGAEATGNNIGLIRNKKIHFRPENLHLRADNATLNGIFLRLPELTAAPVKTYSNELEYVTEQTTQFTFDALVSNGILEGTLVIDFNRQQLTSMRLIGNSVNTAVLTAWHILSSPPEGNEFELSLFGIYNPKNFHGKMSIHNASLHKNYLIEENRILTKPN